MFAQWENIHHERRVELAFEGHRYWDVRRWRTAVTDLSRSWSGIRYILDIQTGKYQLKVVDNIDGTSNVPQFRQENYYFPITISRTSNNPNLAENPGYNQELFIFVQYVINKKNTSVELKLSKEISGAKISYVDLTTGENPPASSNLLTEKLKLEPFAVAVIEL